MSTISYVMTCGCTLLKSQLSRPRNNLKYTCPAHGGIIRHKTYTCEKCGGACTTPKNAPSGKHCNQCGTKNNIERSRQSRKAKRPPVNYALAALHRKRAKQTYNCTRRPQCLIEIISKDRHAEFLPCHNCDRYAPDDVMSQVRTHGGDYERRRGIKELAPC